jgi:hypothetical protein
MATQKLTLKIKDKSKSSAMEHTTQESGRELPLELETQWLQKYKGKETYRKRCEQIRRVNREVFGHTTYNLDDYLTHYDKVIKFIEEQTPAVSKSLCEAVRQSIECLNKTNTPAYKAYYECYGRLIKRKKDSPFEKVNTSLCPNFTWNDFGDLWNQLHTLRQEDKSRNLHQIYLVVSLYYLLPPLRPQDWINSKVVWLPIGTNLEQYSHQYGNILDMNSRTLAISDYKTMATHGTRIIPLGELSKENGDKLFQIINEWLNSNKNKNYLLTTKNGTPIAEQNISKIFDKINIDNETITPTKLRNLFISEKIMDNNISLDKRQRLSYIMGHTVTTQTFVYSKYSKCLHPH